MHTSALHAMPSLAPRATALRASPRAAALIKPNTVSVPMFAKRVQLQVTVAAASNPSFPSFDEAKVKEALGQAQEKAAQVAGVAQGAFNEALSRAKDVKLEIRNLVQWNFVAQLFLTTVSWAVVFTTTHADLAKGVNVNLASVLLLVGVLLSGLSTYQSFTYFKKIKEEGDAALGGFALQKAFYDHITINFIGAAATIVALQAEVGTMFATAVTKGASTAASNASIAAMAQAGCNLLLAHLVSVVFLTFLLRKISNAYESLVAWSESLRASLPPNLAGR